MNGRQRTWVHLTGKGRKAFKAHVEELNRMVALAQANPDAPKS